MNWEIIQEPLRVMWTNTMGFVPNLLAALVILLVGWIVARVVRYLIQRALRSVAFPPSPPGRLASALPLSARLAHSLRRSTASA